MAQELESVVSETDVLLENKSENCFCAFWRAPISRRAQSAHAVATAVTGLLGALFLTAGGLSENVLAIASGAILESIALACGYKAFFTPTDTPTAQRSLDV